MNATHVVAGRRTKVPTQRTLSYSIRLLLCNLLPGPRIFGARRAGVVPPVQVFEKYLKLEQSKLHIGRGATNSHYFSVVCANPHVVARIEE